MIRIYYFIFCLVILIEIKTWFLKSSYALTSYNNFNNPGIFNNFDNAINVEPTILKINRTKNKIIDSFYFSEGECQKDESLSFTLTDGLVDYNLNSLFTVGYYDKIKYTKTNTIETEIVDGKIIVFKNDINNLNNFTYLKMPFESGGPARIVQDENSIYIAGEKYNRPIPNKPSISDLFIAKIDKKSFDFDKNFGSNGIITIRNNYSDMSSEFIGGLEISDNFLFIINMNIIPFPTLAKINKMDSKINETIDLNTESLKNSNFFPLLFDPEVHDILLDKGNNLIIVGTVYNPNLGSIGNMPNLPNILNPTNISGSYKRLFVIKLNSITGNIDNALILNLPLNRDNSYNSFRCAPINSTIINNKVYIGSTIIHNTQPKNWSSLNIFDLDNNKANYYIFKDSKTDEYIKIVINDVKYYGDSNILYLSGGVSNPGYIKFDLNNPNNSSYFLEDNIDNVVIYGNAYDRKNLFLLGGNLIQGKQENHPGQIAKLVIFKINNP